MILQKDKIKSLTKIFLISILSTGVFLTSNCGFIDSAIKKQREKAERNRIETTDEKVKQIFNEGLKAYEEKNYDLAVRKFEEGFNAAPTFPGSAPVFLNNKAHALISRGTDTYNKTVKADEATRNAARQSARNDFEEAVISSENALEILKNANSEIVSIQKTFDANTLIAFTNRKNAYRLLSQTGADRTKGRIALNVFREYMAVEPDPAKKSKAQLELALTLQDSNEFEMAAAEFKKILVSDPNNVDALAGAGLNLVNVGYANAQTDKGRQQLEEAARYLQQYMEIAPETHKFKHEAQGIIESLKETKNPPKVFVKKDNSAGKTNGYSVSKTEIADPNSAK